MSLYIPYKSIGYVCDSNPFIVNRLGEEIFLTVSIGRCFQVFRFNRLIPCLVSKPIPLEGSTISAIQVIGHETIVAAKSQLYVYDRANIVRTYEDHTCNILGLNVVGNHLISYDVENNIKVFDLKLRSKVTEVTVLQKATITALVHPSTYINKFIIGYSNGQLELWNFNKKKIVYTFASHIAYLQKEMHKENNKDGKNTSRSLPSICCIEQSPACDVVALGFNSGDILLLNLKLDCILFSFKHLEGGLVTSISFRTDVSSDRFPYMVTSSEAGRLHIWNLGGGGYGVGDNDDDSDEESSGAAGAAGRRLQSTLEDAHRSRISRVSFIHGEPIMVSASLDNSIKVWIFDSPDGSARLLKLREGHSGTPLRIRHYGGSTNVSMRDNADGLSCEMISAGGDNTLRLFNTAIESQNRELSQKPILKKLGLQRRNERLSECIGFDFTETRQRDWGNLVSIHKDHMNAYVWRFRHRVVTEMILKQPHWNTNDRRWVLDPSHHSSSVALSACGEFAIIGTKGGVIYKYNLQSGLPRGSFPIGVSALSTLKKGSLVQRSKTPGNVLYEQKQIIGDGKAVGANSLNPKGPVTDTTSADYVPSVEEFDKTSGHEYDVSGIFIDMSNSVMVTCGRDGWAIFWNFHTHRVLHRTKTPSGHILLQGFRDANFVAIASEDRVVRVYDMTTFKIARRFAGHSREITDLGFTPDGRRLLTSSLDTTLRVWDLPTGRCVSWCSFDSPIQSMSISLSGEYLCVAQVDKEGLYMYLDRSLYETVHFWREPTHPTPVEDSMVRVDEGEDQEEEGVEGTEGEEEEGEGEDEDMLVTVKPAQAHVVSDDDGYNSIKYGYNSNSSLPDAQKEVGSITMSAVPKVYWTSLFNLEVIKARNKPLAPPTAPPQAPFFLPSVIKTGAGDAGITPSFPNPKEYKKLVRSLETQTGSDSDSTLAITAGAMGVDDGNHDTDARKRRKVAGSNKEEEEEEMMSGMTSAWTDEEGDHDDDEDEEEKMKDGEEGEEGEEGEVSWGIDLKPTSPLNEIDEGEVEKGLQQLQLDGSHRSTSRIINKKTPLPRCKLVAYLEAGVGGIGGIGGIGAPDQILAYLRTLPPSAVDLQIRALCTHSTDEGGATLLKTFMRWLAGSILMGDNFEILQGYLHRTLSIYSEMFVGMPVELSLAAEVEILQTAHATASQRFRHMIQRNLSVLKMMAGVPTV